MASKLANAVPRILVVDDNPQILRLFENILTKPDYAIMTASSGATAMKIMDAHPIDLLVLELSMPAPDGFDLIRSIRSTRPGLKILAVSGSMPNVLLAAAEMLGATATMIKTQAPQLLAVTVARLLALRPSTFIEQRTEALG